jgi:hypothetical protein
MIGHHNLPLRSGLSRTEEGYRCICGASFETLAELIMHGVYTSNQEKHRIDWTEPEEKK